MPFCRAHADSSNLSYSDLLIAEAKEKNLSSDPLWHRLLYYKKNVLFPGVTSLADDPKFFTAQKGKTDPQAELEETLRSFFAPVTGDQNLHPQCIFVARLSWLKEKLDWESSRLPAVHCDRFLEWKSALNAEGITLIFPTAFLNNPGSMFGHTLIRIDGKDQDENTRLLAYAANYAADATDKNALLYAMKGLFGGYLGFYSVLPYYKKVKQYGDFENRDIWEYQLNLKTEEINRMLEHLWELRSMGFRYYYLDENCSYFLLTLFEVARPELRLTDRFPIWSTPIDTVRAVLSYPELLKSVTFRPAQSSVLTTRIKDLTPEEQLLGRSLASGTAQVTDQTFNELSPDKQAAVVEFAYELLNYERLKDRSEDKTVEERGHSLLVERSKLSSPFKQVNVPVPTVRPDLGHKTSRALFGGGVDDHRLFSEFQIRPAYHDLMDKEDGYTLGAQINFLDLTLRHYEGKRVELEDLTVIDIASLPPRNRIFKPISWKVSTGMNQERFSENDRVLVGRLDGGAGLSWKIGEQITAYTLLDGAFLCGGKFDENFSFGGGPNAGVYVDLTENLRINVEMSYQRYFLGMENTKTSLHGEARYAITTDHALKFGVSRLKTFDDYWTEGVVSWGWYF